MAPRDQSQDRFANHGALTQYHALELCHHSTGYLGLAADFVERQGLSSSHRSSTAWAARAALRAGWPG